MAYSSIFKVLSEAYITAFYYLRQQSIEETLSVLVRRIGRISKNAIKFRKERKATKKQKESSVARRGA